MVFQGYDNQVTSQLNLVPRVSHLGTRLVTSLRELSPNTNKSKMTSDCCVFKFLRRSMDGKHLSRFSSETTVSKSSGVVKPTGLKCTSAFTPTLLLHYLATISQFITRETMQQHRAQMSLLLFTALFIILFTYFLYYQCIFLYYSFFHLNNRLLYLYIKIDFQDFRLKP